MSFNNKVMPVLVMKFPSNDDCSLCRPQTEHNQPDTEDDTEPSEQQDVFLTPEKTESLINPSQVDVQTDSTHSLTPTISNMMIPSMSKFGHYFKLLLFSSHTNLFSVKWYRTVWYLG